MYHTGVELRTAEKEILKLTGGRDLGHWFLRPAKATRVVRDASNRITVAVNPIGKGKVITLCFRMTSVGSDAINQIYLAKLLQRLLD